MKTGTTIAGVLFEGGVVLGADTRATGGQTVCDRNCDKIHILGANIACCGAGTSADAERVAEGTKLALIHMAREALAAWPSSPWPRASSPRSGAKDTPALLGTHPSLEMFQREHGKVVAAVTLVKSHLFRHHGAVSAALVLGGVDSTGCHLYQIDPNGCSAKVNFSAMGSGCLAAISVLEGGYREGMEEEEAVGLVKDAISAGIENDLGSGSNVDLCVITHRRGLEHRRGVQGKHPQLTPAGGPWENGKKHDSTLGIEAESMSQTPGEGPSREANSGEKLEEGGEGVKDGGSYVGMPIDELGVDSTGGLVGKAGRSVIGEEPAAPGGVADMFHEEGGGEVVSVGGAGGSRAWVGHTRRRHSQKSVVRVNPKGLKIEKIRSDELDDKVEML
ncbi:unnamed protein product [Discosporangium mesarthrocarpum]